MSGNGDSNRENYPILYNNISKDGFLFKKKVIQQISTVYKKMIIYMILTHLLTTKITFSGFLLYMHSDVEVTNETNVEKLDVILCVFCE